MKKVYKGIVALLLFSGILVGIFSLDAVAQDPVSYIFNFEKDTFLDSNNITYDSTYNIRNKTVFGNVYDGTYSFTGETLTNTGTDISFIDSLTSEINTSTGLLQTYDNHDMVLNISDFTTVDVGNTALVYPNSDLGGLWKESSGSTNWEVVTDTPDVEFMWVEDGDEYDPSNMHLESIDDALTISQVVVFVKGNKTSGASTDTSIDFYNGTSVMGEQDIVGFTTALTTQEFTFVFPTPITKANFDVARVIFTGASALGVSDYVRIYDVEVNATYIKEIPTIEATNYIVDKTFGTVEFWIQSNDTSLKSVIYLKNDGTEFVGFRMYDNQFQYYRGVASAWFDIVGIKSDTWYHVGINFECTGGGYLDLPQYDFSFEINGTVYNDSNFDFYSNEASLNNFSVSLYHESSSYNTYFDAIGYTWESYDWGDNWSPSETVLSDLEIDRWEFGYNEDGEVAPLSQSEIPFWDEAGSPYISPIGDDERSVAMYSTITTHDKITHDFYIDNSLPRRVAFENFFYVHLTGGGETHTWDYNIYSYDLTLITQLRITGIDTLGFYYYNGTDYVLIENNIQTFMPKDYDLDISLDYSYGNALLLINDYPYYIPLINNTAHGLGRIEVDCYATGSDSLTTSLRLDSVGVYINETSITEDFAQYKMHNIAWDTNDQTPYFMNIKATGNFSVTLVNPFDIGDTFQEWFGFKGLSRFKYETPINLGDRTDFKLVFLTNSSNFNVSSIDINNFYLQDEDLTKYYPSFETNGISWNSSYFYVDSVNKLRYQLTSDDDNAEFIQIRFDIPDVSSEERRIHFWSDLNGVADGYLRVNYTDDTSSIFQFPFHNTKTAFILPQSKGVEGLLVLITDNDLINWGDITTGYISEISLLYSGSLTTTITTINLVSILTPLIIMFVPTFAIYERYGKNTILPVFILMSVLCFATGLIPTWLFFIIMLASAGFLFMKKRTERG